MYVSCLVSHSHQLTVRRRSLQTLLFEPVFDDRNWSSRAHEPEPEPDVLGKKQDNRKHDVVPKTHENLHPRTEPGASNQNTMVSVPEHNGSSEHRCHNGKLKFVPKETTSFNISAQILSKFIILKDVCPLSYLRLLFYYFLTVHSRTDSLVQDDLVLLKWPGPSKVTRTF